MTADRIGLLCALPDEISMFSSAKRPCRGDILPLENNLLIGVAGAGQECAGMMAERLADEGVSLLVSWGFAGSVSSSADSSRILLPRQVITENEKYPVDEQLWQQFFRALSLNMSPDKNINQGSIYTAHEIIRTVQDKSSIRKAYGVDSVDMESAAMARVAEARNIKTLVIRAVTDRSFHSIPDDIGDETRWWSVMLNLVRRPGSIAPLIKLAAGYKRALVSLDRARMVLYNEFSLGPV